MLSHLSGSLLDVEITLYDRSGNSISCVSLYWGSSCPKSLGYVVSRAKSNHPWIVLLKRHLPCSLLAVSEVVTMYCCFTLPKKYVQWHSDNQKTNKASQYKLIERMTKDRWVVSELQPPMDDPPILYCCHDKL